MAKGRWLRRANQNSAASARQGKVITVGKRMFMYGILPGSVK
ncbi:Uncharacterised protein [Enterobacter cloacae]|nr:Uncharacterised protein [Enterobacter cloacae]